MSYVENLSRTSESIYNQGSYKLGEVVEHIPVVKSLRIPKFRGGDTPQETEQLLTVGLAQPEVLADLRSIIKDHRSYAIEQGKEPGKVNLFIAKTKDAITDVSDFTGEHRREIALIGGTILIVGSAVVTGIYFLEKIRTNEIDNSSEESSK